MTLKNKESILIALCMALRDSITKKDPCPISLERDEFEDLFRLSTLHAVTSLLNKAVQISQCDEQLKKKWAEASAKALNKEILFDNELSKIEKEFEKENIKYVTLKGIIIKDYYPKKGLRQFCDYDVLIDEKKANEAKDIMKRNGFSVSNDGIDEAVVSSDIAVIDCYKKPIFNFELHKKLFFGESISYFKNIWERIAFENNSIKGKMSDEDIYIFHLAHLYSHVEERSGAGIRYITDHYVLKNTLCKKEDFNKDYVKAVLSGEKAGEKEYFTALSTFEKRLDICADALFEREIPDVSLLVDFLENGIHGTLENKVKISLKNENKFTYTIKRIFPSRRLMRIRYKCLAKFPFLLPFCWIHRAFEIVLDKEEGAKSEAKASLNSQ